jgi:NAD(P)-dependent dehydrogenase (short-subunit alcohol dehydrogenase family)
MRKILITGASRGIGRATALALAGAETHLALSGRSIEALADTVRAVEQRGGHAHAVPMDLRDLAQVESAAHAVVAALGGLDALVHNAGIFDVRPLAETDTAFFEDMLRVNLTAPMVLTRALMPALASSPKAAIVNVLSIAAEMGFPGNSAYSASKYGLRGLSDVWRPELAESGIRVCSVYPKGTDTSIFDGVPGDWDRAAMDPPEAVAALIVRAVNDESAPAELRLYAR